VAAIEKTPSLKASTRPVSRSRRTAADPARRLGLRRGPATSRRGRGGLSLIRAHAPSVQMDGFSMDVRRAAVGRRQADGARTRSAAGNTSTRRARRRAVAVDVQREEPGSRPALARRSDGVSSSARQVSGSRRVPQGCAGVHGAEAAHQIQRVLVSRRYLEQAVVERRHRGMFMPPPNVRPLQIHRVGVERRSARLPSALHSGTSAWCGDR